MMLIFGGYRGLREKWLLTILFLFEDSYIFLCNTVRGAWINHSRLVHSTRGIMSSRDSDKKRLLLNDPEVFDHRLAQLERIVANLQSETMDLKAHIQKQDQIIAANQGGGATYVRWGRTTCPGSGTEIVYSGYAAGQNWIHPNANTRFGGAATSLCLPKDPELNNATFQYDDALIFGTEYEQNTFANDAHDNDMPCAVCFSINFSTSVMIPARRTCYAGWKLEYSGLLAAGHYSHSASSYICVDSHPEYIPSGEKDEDGHRMYVASIRCGPLPCPPYHNNKEVNCVVCSK